MSRISLATINEAVAGLPVSMDPYAPTVARPDVDMSSDTKPPANSEDLPETDPSSAQQQPVVPAGPTAPGEMPAQPGGLQGPAAPVPLSPETNVWEKYPLPNKKDIGFQRGDGFFLRIRRIDSVPGKYLAQLWKDDEILDRGQVIVPPNTDPLEYIKSMADTMLDDNSERYEQEPEPIAQEPQLGPAAGAEAQAQPGAAQEQPELGPEPGVTEQPEQVGLEQPQPQTEPQPGQPERPQPGGAPPKKTEEEEEMCLYDDNFEITDEDLPAPQAKLPQR